MVDKINKIFSIEKIIMFVIGTVLILLLVFVFGAEPCSANILGFNLKLPGCEGTVPNTDPIGGVWTVKAGEGNSEIDVIITIVSGCEPGHVCGTINLPAIQCQASIYLRDIQGTRYNYDAIDHQGNCGPAGVEYLELQSNGALKYSYNGRGIFLRRK